MVEAIISHQGYPSTFFITFRLGASSSSSYLPFAEFQQPVFRVQACKALSFPMPIISVSIVYT
jgi:hypothetical protein